MEYSCGIEEKPQQQQQQQRQNEEKAKVPRKGIDFVRFQEGTVRFVFIPSPGQQIKDHRPTGRPLRFQVLDRTMRVGQIIKKEYYTTILPFLHAMQPHQ